MEKIKAGILGCTGLVGQQFVKMLDAHPYFEITALSSSEASTGKRYSEAVDWFVGGNVPEYARDIVITETSVDALKKKDVKVVFGALPSKIAKGIEKALAGENIYVFSNASAHRMDPDVPIIIPEVNPEHFELVKSPLASLYTAFRPSSATPLAQPSPRFSPSPSTPPFQPSSLTAQSAQSPLANTVAQRIQSKGFIVTNSNCSTAGLVLGLRPLLNLGLKSVTVTTYQALSGAGRHGVGSLDILDNVVPYIKDEEEKIERETKKIFGKILDGVIKHANLEINASCCRVPTRVGHLESVIVEFDEVIDVGDISRVLSSYRGVPQEMRLPTAPEVPIIVKTEENRPQPLLDRNAGTPGRAKGMAITVGRIRKRGKKINFFLLVHNTIRGAAGTCILNAELAIMKNYIN